MLMYEENDKIHKEKNVKRNKIGKIEKKAKS